jgi:myosin heavy subunit
MQKILIIIAASLSLVSIGLGYVNLTHLQNEKAAKLAVTEERDALTKKLAASVAEFKVTDGKLSATTKDFEKSQSDLADTQSRLDKETANSAALQKQVTQMTSDLAQQKTDLDTKDARIAQLESGKSGTGSSSSSAPQLDELKNEIKEKDILNTSLQAKLKENDAVVAELRKNEADRKAKIMRNGLEGRILAVNPSWNFVVLSLGDRNGVVNNAELLISRGGQLIGKVRVTSVEPSTSVADIVANSVRGGVKVQPGDTVIYRGPESSASTDSDVKQ